MQLEDENEISKHVANLKKAAKEVEDQLSKMTAPSTKVDERMDQVKEKDRENKAKLHEGQQEALKARRTFERVKSERLKRFQEFFEPVAGRIDPIYKVVNFKYYF